MTELYRFFGSAAGDPRQYAQTEFAEVLEKMFRNGYFADLDGELQVTATDPARLAVRVASGQAWVNGYFYKNVDWKEIDLDTADATYNRIDRIVLRLDTVDERNIKAVVKTGAPSGSPVAPELTRNAQVWELSLATVLVKAGVTSVTNADITDNRSNDNLCGVAITSESLSSHIGNLSSLSTTDKSSLVNAINELFTSVSNGKVTVASAVSDMGQSATGSDTFSQLASKIRAISNDANATTSQVLSGRTFYQGGQKRTGTMSNRGNVNQTLTSQGQSYTVPSGYHGGSGTVTANISNLSAGNVRAGANVGGVAGNFSQFSNGATAGQILTGRSAAVNGATVNGTMPNRSGHVNSQSRSRSGTTLRLRPQAGYYDGSTSNSVQTSDSNWIASNIREGISIFGLSGTLKEGAPFATGTAVVPSSTPVDVSGLDFEPQFVVVYLYETTLPAHEGLVILHSSHADILSGTSSKYANVRATKNSGNDSFSGSNDYVTINSNGFSAIVGLGGSYRWLAGRWS